MSAHGVNRDFLKRSNRGVALMLLATGRCSSRIELSKEMGLTKAAISGIAAELIEQGLVTEVGTETLREVGRTPVRLEISPSAPKFAGILIQRGYAEAAVCDMNMNILKFERIDKEWGSADELMEAVYSLMDHMLEFDESIAAIGVSSIGPIDVKTGHILRPLFFNNIGDIDVVGLLTKRYGLPVSFDHDNQNSALVEYLYGNAMGSQDILMLGIGRGVGCGIIVGGRRYHSDLGYSPEIGHISIDVRGRQCVCGNIGCLETYIGSAAVEEEAYQATGKRIGYREICSSEDDPALIRVMEKMLENCACGIISLLNLLNCQQVLIGMESVHWPERYVHLLEDMINEKKYSGREERTSVKKVRFLERTPVLGAACNAVNLMFKGEMPEHHREPAFPV